MKLEMLTVLTVLTVLAAVALLPNLSESRTVSRCELKMMLELVISMTPGHKNTSLATIICELEKKSKLNTNLVTEDVHRKPTNHPMTATEEHDNKTNTTEHPSPEEMRGNSSAPPGDRRHSSSHRNPEVTGKPTNQEKGKGPGQGHEKENGPGQGHDSRYGIFQLSGSEFCKSGNVQSQNKCHTNCSAFIDDDIMDDTKCFMEHNCWMQILNEASSDCHNQTSSFFSGCN